MYQSDLPCDATVKELPWPLAVGWLRNYGLNGDVIYSNVAGTSVMSSDASY